MREIPIVFGARAARLELELLKWIHTKGGEVNHDQIFRKFAFLDMDSFKREEKWERITDVRLASAIDDLVVYGMLIELGCDAYGAESYQLTRAGTEAVLCATDLKKAKEFMEQ